MTTYNVADAVSSTVGFGSLTMWGWVYSISTFLVIVGGMASVARFAEKLVPFMCLFYVIAALVVIVMNIANLPAAIALIVKSAFTPTAAVGGFLGSTVAQALTIGMKRALYSNEAGWGTSPMIHASAKVDHPIKQGMWGAFEVFVDTCIVCMLTGLVIVITGAWDSGLAGASLTLSAFESSLGSVARWIIAISVYLFAFSTTGGWWAYNEVLLRQVLDVQSKAYKVIIWCIKVIYPLAGLIWVYLVVYQPELASGDIWLIGDLGSGIPTFANLFALLFMFGTFKKLLKDYKARYMGIGKVDPNFKVFYNDEDAPVLKDRA
jgi:AGCS family alanine or glycine:cation symporter